MADDKRKLGLAQRRKRPGEDPRGNTRWTWWALPSAAIAFLPSSRLALLLAGAGLVLVFTVFAAVALGSAFASRDGVRRAAARTLDLLLRLVPWYTPRR
uniref:hypothetical protein n=1 Tax=Nonomuraea sp. CA-252377 TaxID=3240003 RepID=UPI003F49459A